LQLLNLNVSRSKSRSNFHRRKNFKSKSRNKADISNSEICYYHRKFSIKAIKRIISCFMSTTFWPSLINKKTKFAVKIAFEVAFEVASDNGLINNRFIFSDKSSGFLMDTEADISLIPRRFCPKLSLTSITLFATNSSVINTYITLRL